MRYIREHETFYIVEYKSGICRRFIEPTDGIINFISELTPTTRTYSNGALKIETWE